MSNDYSDWHPAQQVADAAKKYTELIEENRRPKHRPATPPRPADEQARVEELQALTCPSAPNLRHWFPPEFTECVRGCGLTLELEPAA